VPATSRGTVDLDSVVGQIRTLWATVDRMDAARRAKLHERIVDGITRLKKQIEGHIASLAMPVAAVHPLFPTLIRGEEGRTPASRPGQESCRFPEPILRLYDKDLADQALATLPQAARFANVDDFREHLARTLPFNAVSTRRRAANYLTGRFFPDGIIHGDLARFVAASEGRTWLGDVLFYLTCRVEKIVALVAEDVVWPSLADGGISRGRIADYVRNQVPTWSPNSIQDVGAAVVRTYERLGVARPSRAKLVVSQRRGDFPSFAYILHSFFIQ
jgi:hypothetical protein